MSGIGSGTSPEMYEAMFSREDESIGENSNLPPPSLFTISLFGYLSFLGTGMCDIVLKYLGFVKCLCCIMEVGFCLSSSQGL